jgi:hypothetical protein
MGRVYRLVILLGSRHNDPAGSLVGVAYHAPIGPGNDVTAYIVIENFGQYGRAFRDTDLAPW